MHTLKRTSLHYLQSAKIVSDDYHALNVVSGKALVMGKPLQETKFPMSERIYADDAALCVIETDADLQCEELPKTEFTLTSTLSALVYMHEYEPAYVIVESGHVEYRGRIIPPGLPPTRLTQHDVLLNTMGKIGEHPNAKITICTHRQVAPRVQSLNARLQEILIVDQRNAHQQWIVHGPNVEPAWILKGYLERIHKNEKWEVVEWREDIITFHSSQTHYFSKFFDGSPLSKSNLIVFSSEDLGGMKLCPDAFVLTPSEAFYQAHKRSSYLLPTIPRIDLMLVFYPFEPDKFVRGVMRTCTVPTSCLPIGQKRQKIENYVLEEWKQADTPKLSQKWGLSFEKPIGLSMGFQGIWSKKGTSIPITCDVYVLIQ